MSYIFEKIKKKKLKAPTQFGFSLKKWEETWKEIEAKATSKDKKLYQAGVVIFNLLQEIRGELTKLYNDSAPNSTNTKLLKAYIALSNRDRAILGKQYKNTNVNVISTTYRDNSAKNEITFQEIADGAVDGLEKAIFFCKKRINDNKELVTGARPKDELAFIDIESKLSQLYGIYENYWHAILWCDYEFVEYDKENKVFMVRQPVNDFEIGACVSQIRKSRLGAQSATISLTPQIQEFFKGDRYVSIIKQGKKKKLAVLSIKNASDEVKAANSDWRTNSIFLSDSFSSESLSVETSGGFSINEALDVFRNLMLLSIALTYRYPNDDSIFNLKKYFQFCPAVNKLNLKVSISKATGLNVIKVGKILDFLEYKASDKQDLWCHPILSVSQQDYIVSTSALLTPVILRVVEHWFVTLGLELSQKGETFEKLVIEQLNKAIQANRYISDFDKAVSRRIKIDAGEEEIDLLLRVGNVVLIGEAKSIVTTDSPISNYRTVETLKGAAKQIKRKTGFVQRNQDAVFNYLGWDVSSDLQLSFIPCIINSGRMYVGFEIDGISVCDEKILTKYFSDNQIPLVSCFDKVTREPKHLAWIELYNSFEELQSNIKLYLKYPPQIFEEEKHFEYKKIQLPSISSDSFKIFFVRLVPKELTVRDRIEINHHFPLRKVSTFEEDIKEVDFII